MEKNCEQPICPVLAAAATTVIKLDVPKGALSVPDVLATKGWYEQRLKEQNARQ